MGRAVLYALAFGFSSHPLSAQIFINSRFTGVLADAVAVDDNNVSVIDTKGKEDRYAQPGPPPPVIFNETASAPGSQSTARATTTVNATWDFTFQALKITASGTSSAFAERTPAQGTGNRRATGTSDSDGMLVFFSTNAPCTFTVTGQVSATGGGASGRIAFAEIAIRQSGNANPPVYIFRSTAAGNQNNSISMTGTLPAGDWNMIVGANTLAQARSDTPAGGSPSASFDCRIDIVAGAGPTPTPTPTPGPSSVVQWNNPGGGSFNTASNWDPQQVPSFNDTALFGLQTVYTVDVGSAATDRLVVSNGNVTFTNLNYNVGATSFDTPGTVLDNARLTLENGFLNGVHALIGESAASRVDVNDAAIWTLTGSLRVGGPGEGILAIAEGGAVVSGEGRIGSGAGGGMVTVSGAGRELGKWQSRGRI